MRCGLLTFARYIASVQSDGRFRSDSVYKRTTRRILSGADRPASCICRDSERNQILRQVVGVAVQQQPEPVVEIGDDAKACIEATDAARERRSEQHTAGLAEQVGAAADAVARGAAGWDHAAGVRIASR